MEETTQRCPFCAEEILAAAIRCKHCGANLAAGQGSAQAPQAVTAKAPKRTRWKLIVGSLVLLVGFYTCAKHGDKGASGTEKQTYADVPIDTLLSEYKDNEVRADGKYKGKYVRVSGVVDAIGKDIVNSMYVTIGTGARMEIPRVQCFLRSDQVSAASALTNGVRAKIAGKVDGKMMNVLIHDCELQ